MTRNNTLIHYNSLLNQIDEYIDRNLCHSFGIGQLADQVHVSYYHLSDVFLKLRNRPLGTYINQVRVERAAMLCYYTQATLTDIADKVGYSTKHALSKAMTNHFQMSPRELKKHSLFRKDSANIMYDGIRSAEAYASLIRREFEFSYTMEYIDDAYIAGETWMPQTDAASYSLQYKKYLQQLQQQAAGLPGSTLCLRPYDAINFTPAWRSKMIVGLFMQHPLNDNLKTHFAAGSVYPVKKGKYLVFEVPAGPVNNIKHHITLFRENLIGYKRSWKLEDFHAFFLFSADRSCLGKYYMWYSE
jgi:AraC-like DNA-binding protein